MSTGNVFRIDTESGQTSIAIAGGSSRLFQKGKNEVFGEASVNGIRVHGGELYVANSGTGELGKMAIEQDGTLVSAKEPAWVAKVAKDGYWDDFAVDAKGNVFAGTGSANVLLWIDPTGETNILGGQTYSTDLAGPTSAALSRGRNDTVLYVVTSGAAGAPVNGKEVVGGQVRAIDIGNL